MELGNQIKKYRSELQISQEQLADRIYVSRQTISNWEYEKSYPDVNSLILLSEVFQTSIDKLIKGDIEIMKEKINEQEIKKLNYYGNIFGVHFAITILSAVPCSFGWNSLHLFRLEFFL
jgi:transcriptional regulator with XRE-family HTH domain